MVFILNKDTPTIVFARYQPTWVKKMGNDDEMGSEDFEKFMGVTDLLKTDPDDPERAGENKNQS